MNADEEVLCGLLKGRSYAGGLAKILGKSHTAVGTTLNRLEANGLAESHVEPLEEAVDRAPRRYFNITAAGVKALESRIEWHKAEAASIRARLNHRKT